MLCKEIEDPKIIDFCEKNLESISIIERESWTNMDEEQEPDKKVVGGPGITAGDDVTFGDVSGQVAIGDGIIQYKN